MGKCLEFVGGSVIDFNLGECVGNLLAVGTDVLHGSSTGETRNLA